MSSKNIEVIKKFNTLMDSFLTQISPLIGKSMKIFFNTAIKFNASKGIRSFYQYVGPFRDKVLKEDENYFYEVENYSKEIDNLDMSHSGSNGKYLNEILKFKKIYDKIKDNEKNKKNLWKYLKALLLLSEEYGRLNKLKLSKTYGRELLKE